MIREADQASDVLPGLRICPPAASASAPESRNGSGGATVATSRTLGIRRPGSLGSRSASDSEEERPDSSLESTGVGMAGTRRPEFGSAFSLGLSVGLRLGQLKKYFISFFCVFILIIYCVYVNFILFNNLIRFGVAIFIIVIISSFFIFNC